MSFTKLLNRTPEEQEQARIKTLREIEARTQRELMMIDKLYDQMSRGCINNDWAEGFIDSLHKKLHGPMPYLTEKQLKTLEELFERY